MALSTVPFALQNAAHNADLFREAVSSLVPNAGGLVQAGDLAVTQTGTPSMAVQAGVGRVWVKGTEAGNLSGQSYGKQGLYFAFNDAAVTKTVATAHATNPRIDVLCVYVQDSQYSGSNNLVDFMVVTGTPAPSPTVPTIPANALALANIAVAANASSIVNANITTVSGAPLTLGKPIVVADKAARDALVPYLGMEVMRQDRDSWVQTYTGSAWEYLQKPKRYQAVSGDWVNLAGTASRLICTIAAVPTKAYAQKISVYGRTTILCPTISTGTQEINFAVSAGVTQVTAAQGKSRISWTPGYSNINQSSQASALDVALAASATPFVRAWIEVVNGGLSTTASAGLYADLYCDVRPDDD